MSPILCLGLQALLVKLQYRGATAHIHVPCSSAITRVIVDGSIDRGSIDNFPHAWREAHDVDVYT